MSWLRLSHRININYHGLLRGASPMSSVAKSKQKSKYKQESKYKPESKSKSKQKSTSCSNSLYEAPSLSDYEVNKANIKKPSGWNGTFYSCHTLLNHNPYGVTSMMHSFNTSSTTVGCVLFGSIYYCSYYSMYSFPASWLFAWFCIRLFTDLFPMFPRLYSSIIEQYAFNQFPVLKYLRFSRKLPDPELQSMSSMVKERLNKAEKLKAKKRLLSKTEENVDIDLDDVHITDDMLAKRSVLGSWKVRQRAHAKKYGLSWDIVENVSTVILMPILMSSFTVIGIGDPLISVFLQNSALLASNDWIIKFGTSYVVASYLTRLVSIPIFRYWCVPRAFDKFGPHTY